MKTSPTHRRVLRWTLAPLFAGGLLVASTAAAAPPEAGHGHGRVERMCRMLECSDDQERELRAAMKEARQDSKKDREAVRRLRKEMAEEFAKDAPSVEKLSSLQKQIAKHRQAMDARRLDAMMEIHAILSKEQRVKFAEFMEKRGRKGRHGQGKGPKGKARAGN